MSISRRVFFSVLFSRPEQTRGFEAAVLETFVINGACVAALVHHHDAANRDAFARWLQASSKSMVRVRNSTGTEMPATLFRVRMCFGRGLILLKEPMPIRERDFITILT
jgi:hypothetical protein